MKKVFIITCALLVTNTLTAQDSVVTKLNELITAYAKLNRFNGTVLVAKQGTVLLQKGYGVKNAEDKLINDFREMVLTYMEVKI